jgi:hypothetical protein
MIASTSMDLWNAYRAVRRGRFKDAARILGVKDARRLAGRYLEFNYGWKPLFLSIEGSYELFNQQVRKSLLVTGRRTISNSKQRKPQYGYDGYLSTKIRHRCIITGSIDDTYERIAQQGLGNPATVAWELIPLSFVADWVLPVGDFLQALQAPCGLNFVSGAESTVAGQKFRITKSNPSWTVVSPSGIQGKGFTFVRKALTGFPNPSPFYAKSPFSTRKVLSAIALLAQRV